MFESYRRIQERRAAAQGDEWGFTLIELLIVIIVLGILAAVVVFALGGVTGKSAISACNADAKSVETASEAFKANSATNAYPADSVTVPGPPVVTTDTDLTGTGNGGPYLHTWPSNDPHYTITLVGGQVMVATAKNPTAVLYDAQTSTTGCNSAA
jgi:prepilin-type N-terminal cleavage/methylation domain-containing protein